MKNETLTKEQFLKDVSNHKMNILKDDGLYRHINFEIPNNSNRSFSITTFPGYLVITGDMGDFVFSRIEDMFEFFDTTDINPDYWAEKVVAESTFGKGVKCFDSELFKENVFNHAREFLELDEKEKIPSEYLDELETILSSTDEYECVEAIRNFSSDKINFDDFWNSSCDSLTFHFIWCCFAINWSINQYNTYKNANP